MSTFTDSVSASLSSRGISFNSFCDLTNNAEKTIFNMYGAAYLSDYYNSIIASVVPQVIAATVPFGFVPAVATEIALTQDRIKFPNKMIFADESAVTSFQTSLKIAKDTIGGITIELQQKAMATLKEAEKSAKASKLTITPRPDATAARRSYAETAKFWNNKIADGIKHWKANKNKDGKTLSEAEANDLNAKKGVAQINKVLELEAKNFFFSTDKKKTILASVAAPGTSQHLLMIALDIKEFSNHKVRKIMAEHGWFQTVFSDHPHFTFLGVRETNLVSLGLTKKTDNGQDFWVP